MKLPVSILSITDNLVAELSEDIIVINIRQLSCGLISYKYALHLCVYRLAIFSSAGQLMIAGQLENEECDYEFCPHSCVPPFTIKTSFYIALTKCIPYILDYFIYRLVNLEDWLNPEY